MRIAFVVPPALSDGKFVEAEDCCWGASERRVLPAMLLAALSEAKRAGHIVKFVDLTIDAPRLLRQFRAEVVVYPLAWQYHRETHAAMTAMCGRTPSIALAIPAGYAPHYAQLTPGPFCVAYSEPEIVIAGLPLETSGLGAWREEAFGLTWVDKSGELRQSTRLRNYMGSLGPVDFSAVPAYYWLHYHAAVYQVTRGCPYRCTFCVWGASTVTDRAFRMRPAAMVAADIQAIRDAQQIGLANGKQKQLTSLYLLSAQLTTDIRWIRAFHNEKKNRDSYPFQSNVNLAELTEEKLGLLMESGMTHTSAGLEGASDVLLKRLRKPHSWDDAVRSIQILEASGIEYKLHLRSGFGESADEILAAIDNLHELKRLGIERLKINLGPIIHYEGTDIRSTRNYPLLPHPNYKEECLYMSGIPNAAWNKYIEVLKEYGWLAGWGLSK